MEIQAFSTYLQLAQAGKVDFLACPMHIVDSPAIFPLLHKEENNKVVLHCLACGYKNTPGEQVHRYILDQIKKAENE